MSEPAPAAVAVDTALVLRCDVCDVTWRGKPSEPCWCCGARGDRRGEVRVVPD